MAIDKKPSNNNLGGQTDRTAFYSDLAYIPKEYKARKLWMAQSIFYAKKNSSLLVDPVLAAKYRGYDLMTIDPLEYRALIDPPSKKSNGLAEHTAADFKSFPIDIHLDNLIRAALEKIPNNLSVKVADPVAKAQEQKDKEKIIFQRIMREFINSMNAELGLPKIQDTQDPYKWAEAYSKQGKGGEAIDTVGNPIDMIRNRVKNDDQLRMYMKYLYKNGLEIAFEAAIQYYFINLNKWELRQDKFNNDLKNFNTCTGMWYTDATTGRPILKYLDPVSVYTSPFVERDGSDILYWGYEFYVSFAEFERMFGAKLRDDQKKKILEVNKLWNGNYGSDVGVQWQAGFKTNAQIKMGYYSVLTQEAEEFSKYYVNNEGGLERDNNASWDGPSEINEKPNPNQTYNVWYSCYYIPMPSTGINDQVLVGNEGWEWLAEYVFDIQKNVDMERYGVDSRYAKSALVVYRDNSRPSYTAIKYRFMPKINTLWHRIQNCIIQDINGMGWDEDLLAGVLQAVDSANEQDSKGGGDALINSMKTLKQSGVTWLKFRDANGNLVVTDPSKLFVAIKSGHMEAAQGYFMMMLQLYNEMTKALAMSDAASAEQPDPRTPAAGIQIAAEATKNARWYIERAVIETAIMFGERTIQWVNTICKDKKEFGASKRWDEFVQVVGLANGATIESIEDINFENVGVSVKSENTAAIKQLIVQVATEKMSTGQISSQDWGLILDSGDNWKLQIVEMSMAEEAKNEQLAAQQQAQFEQAMALEQQRTQTALALAGAKAEGVNSNIQTEAQMQAMIDQQMGQIKAQTKAEEDVRRKDFKEQESVLKSELDKDREAFKKNLENQSAF